MVRIIYIGGGNSLTAWGVGCRSPAPFYFICILDKIIVAIYIGRWYIINVESETNKQGGQNGYSKKI